MVETIDRVRHRRYAKTVQRNKNHDEENTLNIGDRVCPGDSPKNKLAARRDPGAYGDPAGITPASPTIGRQGGGASRSWWLEASLRLDW